MKTYYIANTTPKATAYVCKMMGPDAVGISYDRKDRLQFKTLNGAVQGMRRLYKNGLIHERWYVTGPSPVFEGETVTWTMKNQIPPLFWT